MCRGSWAILLCGLLLAAAHAEKPQDVAAFDDYENEEVDHEAKPAVKEKKKELRTPLSKRVVQEEEDEFVLDEDEFEGLGTAPPKPRSKAPELTEKQNYLMEYCVMVFIGLYAVVFFVGRRQNERIGRAWYHCYEEWFKTQFYSSGFQDVGLLKDSQSCYKFYATGRRFCTGMLVTLDLRKRHDLFSLAGGGSEDVITIEIPMLDDDMEPFVFAVTRRKAEKRMKKSHKDLENLAVSLKSRLLPEGLILLTDCPDLEPAFLDERTCRTMASELFRSLHFTDSGSVRFNSSTKLLRFEFRLPIKEEMAQLRLLIEMAIFFVDRVAQTKLSAAAKQKNLTKRKLVAEQEYKASRQQREEAAAKRKEEAKAADPKAAARKKEAKEKKAKQQRIKIIR